MTKEGVFIVALRLVRALLARRITMGLNSLLEPDCSSGVGSGGGCRWRFETDEQDRPL